MEYINAHPQSCKQKGEIYEHDFTIFGGCKISLVGRLLEC